MRIEIAETDEQKSLWNEYVDRYHYLGYMPMVGALSPPTLSALPLSVIVR